MFTLMRTAANEAVKCTPIAHDELSMRNSILNNKGYSLIELIIVVAILAILLSVASPSMDFIRRERVTSHMREMVADIQKTRSDAISSFQTNTVLAPFKRGSGIRFASPTSYVKFDFNDSIPAMAAGGTSTGNFLYDGIAEEVSQMTKTFTSTQIQIWMPQDGGFHAPANDIVIFDRAGLPHQADWRSIGMDNVPVTITIRDPALPADYTRCIFIRAMLIQEGFWNVGACNMLQ
jgi:prepilin-type N-terminal cleavage/methylation domain-containing protein